MISTTDPNDLWSGPLEGHSLDGDTACLRGGMGEEHRTGSHAHATSCVALSETMNHSGSPSHLYDGQLKSHNLYGLPPGPFPGHTGTEKGCRERSLSHSFFQQMFTDRCSVPGIVLRALPLAYLIPRGQTEETATVSSCRDLQRLTETASTNKAPRINYAPCSLACCECQSRVVIQHQAPGSRV